VLGIFIFLGASKDKFSSAVVLAKFNDAVLKLDLLLWTSLQSRCLLAFRVLGLGFRVYDGNLVVVWL
jgi:hypothetical protein